jgi:hypothetical protein
MVVIELEFSLQILENCTHFKFHANPCSGIPVFLADRQGQADLMKLIDTFSNFASRPTMMQARVYSYLDFSNLITRCLYNS